MEPNNYLQNLMSSHVYFSNRKIQLHGILSYELYLLLSLQDTTRSIFSQEGGKQ